MADKWLKDEIIDGLEKLFALRLQGTPAADTIRGVGMIWFEAVDAMPVVWDQRLDTPRIRHSFSVLLRTLDTWPAPKRFIETLPQRRPQRVLPAPPISEEKRRENIQRIRQIKANLCNNLLIKESNQ